MPRGALPSPYLKIGLRLPSSAGLSAQSQAAGVTYSMSVSSAKNPPRAARPGPVKLLPGCGQTLGAGLSPHSSVSPVDGVPSAEPKVVQNLHLQEQAQPAPGRR